MVPFRGAFGTAGGGQMVPPKSQKGAIGTAKGGIWYGMEKRKEAQTTLVAKQNDLIRRSRYDMTARGQKVLLYLISKIKPVDDDISCMTVDLRELCEVCGTAQLTKNFRDVASIIEDLFRVSFLANFGDGWGHHHWLQSAVYPETVGMSREELEHFVPKVVQIGFADELRPYLLHLRQNYTLYQLDCVLAMRSKYAIRLYEILKSYAYIGEYTTTIADLREDLQIAGYTTYKDIRRRVLDPAVEEINEVTDIFVDPQPLKTGRAITGIRFDILTKEHILGDAAERKRDKALNG